MAMGQSETVRRNVSRMRRFQRLRNDGVADLARNRETEPTASEFVFATGQGEEIVRDRTAASVNIGKILAGFLRGF